MERLRKNLGRYHGETIDIDRVCGEVHELAVRGGWECDTFLEIPSITLRGYRKKFGAGGRRIYFSTGIHGDEPAGPLAMRQLLESNPWPEGAEVWLVPCLNPEGFRRNTRENGAGIDLNREYRSAREPEVRAHIAWLERQPSFDQTVILHEDWEANGFYVYELNPRNARSLAEPIIERMAGVCPVETAEQVDGWPCQAGIIRPEITPEEREHWPEAVHLISHKSPCSYTLEAPSDYPLKVRVEAHVRAVETVCQLLERAEHDSAGS